MDRLKHMKHKLVEVAEKEINENLECVDTKELGEVIDMIKDLAEAIYYCTVTEAMETKEHWESLEHKVDEAHKK
jgi:signal transduction histidine kinase